MIQTIEQDTQSRILIGQNGILVVTVINKVGIALAFKAIRLVEEEAHTSNLTQRVKDLLNVSEEVASETETNNSSVNNEEHVNNDYADNNSNEIENGHNSNNTLETSRDST
jgi:exosome complex RNA-binding protein Rrp4